jgi:hypothetical protein
VTFSVKGGLLISASKIGRSGATRLNAELNMRLD